jgi:hypothetical protein
LTIIAVGIVNYNGHHLLKRHLPALMDQEYSDYEVILADGGSTDSSVPWVRSEYPDIRIIQLAGNPGFASANNSILSATTTPLIALLNNDASPDPQWLSRLASAASTYPEFGMFASRMLFAHNPAIINSAGISLDRAGIAWDRYIGSEDAGPTMEVFGPSAGAALYRRAMFDDIGNFDESFFAYLEDVDLAWRARLAGWKCLFVADANVRHEHSATGIEGSSFKNYHLGRNKIWSILKNYPMPQALAYSPLIVLYDLMSVCLTLIRTRDISVARGRLSAIWNWRKPWLHRHRPQSQHRISWAEFCTITEGFQSPLALYRRYNNLRKLLANR